MTDRLIQQPISRGRSGLITVTFAAAAAAQTLTIRCSLAADEGSGWVSLQAATLRSPSAQTGVLGGAYTVLAVASTVDLTDEGKIDWAHWGLDLPTDIDRKIGGTNVISDFSVIGLRTRAAFRWKSSSLATTLPDIPGLTERPRPAAINTS